jgi:hypothetical protein
MVRYANENSIKMKGRIGKILSFVGLGVLLLGFLLSLNRPEQVNVVIVSAIAGVIMSQVGVTMVNRWGRSPRVDELLDTGLKGMSKDLSLFHYLLGANHVMISPSGLFTLIPRFQDGEITYEDGQWFQSKKRFLRRDRQALKHLDTDAELDRRALHKALKKHLTEDQIPPINSIIVFLHSEVSIEAEGADIPVVHIKQLKSFVRKLPSTESLSDETVQQLAEATGVAPA